MAIEEHFKMLAGPLALSIEAADVLVVALGALNPLMRVAGLAIQSFPDIRTAIAST